MERKRYFVLDGIRGITLLSMVVYHAIWDLVYIFNKEWTWYKSEHAYIWQQSICWIFILLSGFCWSLSKNKIKRGLTVFMAGMVISCVTILFMPENKVIFGVLTMIGACMWLMIPLDSWLKRCNPSIGMVVSLLLFLVMRNVNIGFLGFECWNIIKLPEAWYKNLLTTFLGFPLRGFYSTDYFSLFPWMFLFIVGYFLYKVCEEKSLLKHLKHRGVPQIEWIGKNSMMIYMIHQPILFLGISLYCA